MNKIDLAAYLLETDYLQEGKKAERKELVKAELEKRSSKKSEELPTPVKDDSVQGVKEEPTKVKTSEEKIAEAKARKAKFEAQKKADIAAGIRNPDSSNVITKALSKGEAEAIDRISNRLPSEETAKKVAAVRDQEKKIKASKEDDQKKSVRIARFDMKAKVGETTRLDKFEPDTRISSDVILGIICHVLRKDGMYIGKTAKETEYDPATIDKVRTILDRFVSMITDGGASSEEKIKNLLDKVTTAKDLAMRDLLYGQIQIASAHREDIKRLAKKMVPGGAFNYEEIPSIVHTISSWVTDQHVAAYRKWKVANEKHKVEEREKGVENPADLPKPAVWLDTHFDMWADRQKKNAENIDTEKKKAETALKVEAGIKEVNKAIEIIKSNIEPDYLGTPGTTKTFTIDKIKSVFRVDVKAVPKKEVTEKIGDMMDELMKAFATLNKEEEEVSESIVFENDYIKEECVRTGNSFSDRMKTLLEDKTPKPPSRDGEVLSTKIEDRIGNLGLGKKGVDIKDLKKSLKSKSFDDKEIRKIRGQIEDIKSELDDILSDEELAKGNPYEVKSSDSEEVKKLKQSLGVLVAKETDLVNPKSEEDEDVATGKDKALYMVLKVEGLTNRNSHLVPFSLYLTYSQFNSEAVESVFGRFPSFGDVLRAKRKTIPKSDYDLKENAKVTAVIGSTNRVAKFTTIGLALDDEEEREENTVVDVVKNKTKKLEKLKDELSRLDNLSTKEHHKLALGLIDQIKTLKAEIADVTYSDAAEAKKYSAHKGNSSVAGLQTYARKDEEYDKDRKYIMIDWTREIHNPKEILDAVHMNPDRYRGVTDLYIPAPDNLNVDLSKKIGKEDVTAAAAINSVKRKAIEQLKARDDGRSSPYLSPTTKNNVSIPVNKWDIARKAQFKNGGVEEKVGNIIGHTDDKKFFSTNIPLKDIDGNINPTLSKIFDNFPKTEKDYDAVDYLLALAKKSFKLNVTVNGFDIKAKASKYPVRLTKTVEVTDVDGNVVLDKNQKPVKEQVPNYNGKYNMGADGEQRNSDIINLLKNEKEVVDKFTGITRVTVI